MKLEETDSERGLEMKVEDLLYEYNLLEAKPKIGNILKKKNAVFDRKVSKEGYATVVSELSKIISENKKYKKMLCSKIKGTQNRKECRKRINRSMVERINILKGQCIGHKHHQKRCLRRCDTLISYFEKESNS